MINVEVCLTPDLIDQHDLSGKTVVAVDIFRATSCMVSGLASGVISITPVSEVEECKALMAKGFVGAGERGGKKVEGFDIGNSPFSYMAPELSGKKIAVTTTNGTLTINKSLAAEEIIIGAFLNLTAVAEYIESAGRDIVIHCAGWKGTPNLEDTAFAGALIDQLGSYQMLNDSAIISLQLYRNISHDLAGELLNSSHAKRLASFGIEEDLKFCSALDKFSVIPVLRNGELTAL